MRSVMIPLGDSRLRLLEPLDKQKLRGQVSGATWGRPAPLGAACRRHLGRVRRDEAGGYRLLSDEIEIGAGGRLHFLVDPSAANGVLLEICQDPISAV